MTVNKPGRLSFLNKLSEAFKSLMAWVFLVLDKAWWSMAYDNIKFPGGEELEPFSKDASFHFSFVVLMLAAVVPS